MTEIHYEGLDDEASCRPVQIGCREATASDVRHKVRQSDAPADLTPGGIDQGLDCRESER